MRCLECNTKLCFTSTVFPYLLGLKFIAIGNKFIIHCEYLSRPERSNLHSACSLAISSIWDKSKGEQCFFENSKCLRTNKHSTPFYSLTLCVLVSDFPFSYCILIPSSIRWVFLRIYFLLQIQLFLPFRDKLSSGPIETKWKVIWNTPFTSCEKQE